MRKVLVAAVLAVLAVPAAALAAAETFTYTETTPITGVTKTPCGSAREKLVLTDGFAHTTVHSTVDDTGALHYSTVDTFHFKAVTPGGTTYVANRETTVSFTGEGSGEGGAITGTVITKVTFERVGRQNEGTGGNEPEDLNATVIDHLTFNANGELTSYVLEFNGGCQ